MEDEKNRIVKKRVSRNVKEEMKEHIGHDDATSKFAKHRYEMGVKKGNRKSCKEKNE